jgi:hypothetical protein
LKVIAVHGRAHRDSTRRATAGAWIVCLAALGLFGACSGDTRGGGVPSGPIPLDSLPSEYANAYCDQIGPCCRSATIPFDPASCRDGFRQLLQSSIDAARRELYAYDATAAGECLRGLDVPDDGCFSAEGTGASPICDEVFAGTLAPGDECLDDLECARSPRGSASCDEDDEGVRRCTQERRGSPGSACNWTCRELGTARFCSGTGSEPEPYVDVRCFTSDGLHCSDGGRCEQLAGLGDPCTGDDACEDALYCDFEADLCSEPKGEGAECSSSDECQGGLRCGDELVCSPLGVRGTPCELSSDCVGTCTDGTCQDDDGLLGFGAVLLCSPGALTGAQGP